MAGGKIIIDLKHTLKSEITHYKTSQPEVFCKKDVLRNFAKFTRKHLCPSLFFNKVAGLRPATLLKKRLWHRCFPVNFVKFLRTPFLTEHVRWLLLSLLLILIYYSFLHEKSTLCKLLHGLILGGHQWFH